MKLFKQNNKHFTMWYNLSKQWVPGKIWKVDLGGTRLVWSLEPVSGKLQKPLSGTAEPLTSNSDLMNVYNEFGMASIEIESGDIPEISY